MYEKPKTKRSQLIKDKEERINYHLQQLKQQI